MKKKKKNSAGYKPLKSNPEVAERSRRALELRTIGWTYARIAEHLGYAHPSGAYEAVKNILAATLQETADEHRKVEGERLDLLLRRFIPIALSNDETREVSIKAGTLVEKYIGKRFDLFGLTATKKIEHHFVKEYDVTNSPEDI